MVGDLFLNAIFFRAFCFCVCFFFVRRRHRHHQVPQVDQVYGVHDHGTLTKKSGNIFRVGIFLDFVWLTTRTMHPHGAYVRRARRNRIDRHGGVIERLALQALPTLLCVSNLCLTAFNNLEYRDKFEQVRAACCWVPVAGFVATR